MKNGDTLNEEEQMKKHIAGLLVVGLMTAGTVREASAQEKSVNFSLNLGIQTNLYKETSFDNAWFSLDFRAGIRLGRSFEISPEVMAAVDDSLSFDAVWLYPGLMLNYAPGGFFIGIGAVLPVWLTAEESDTGNLAPKINIGFRSGRFTVTAYLFTWTESGTDFLDYNFVGATLGYRF